jgi:DNA repair protein RecO (recombination protein O)
MQVTTRAIVLHVVNFRETSLIATVFCESGGKMAVLAKGAKALKSPLFGKFEPGNRLEVVLSVKQGREVQQVTYAALLGGFQTLWSQPGVGALVYNTLELSAQLLHERQEQKELFQFLFGFLSWASDSGHGADMRMLPYVQFRLSDLYGIGMEIGQSPMFFNVEGGQIEGAPQGFVTFALTEAQRIYVEQIRDRKSSKLPVLAIPRSELNGLIHMFDVYLRHHIEHLKPRVSASIFDQLDLIG